MPVLRYAAQEAGNIARAAATVKQAVALDAYRQGVAQQAELDAAASEAASKLEWTTPPVSAADAGGAGQIAYDGSHLYVCVSADTWVRAALSTW